jgi:hypothetical protein
MNILTESLLDMDLCVAQPTVVLAHSATVNASKDTFFNQIAPFEYLLVINKM